MANDVYVSVKNDNTSAIKAALGQAYENALERIGMKAENYAKNKCPVDTGRLRNSITYAVSGDTVFIGSNVEYAQFVESGSSKQKAKPYLRPAATEHGDEYREILQDALKSG